MAASDLTAARVRELVTYDPDTGVFVWLPRTPACFNSQQAFNAWSARFPGRISGSKTNEGYWCLRLDNKGYQAHRVAWLYVFDEWPRMEIDHINGNKLDNRIGNLRDVGRFPNAQNQWRRKRKDRLLPMGVTRVRNPRSTKPYRAKIVADGVSKFLGVFETMDLAEDAYLQAKMSLHAGATI